MTDTEIKTNQRALDHALAQQRLEGLTVTPETVAALNRVAKGEIPMSSVITGLYARYAHVKVLEL